MIEATCMSQALKYLEKFPDEAPIVEAIVICSELLFAKNAQEVAEMLMGREILEEEWNRFGDRWDRAWNEIMRFN